MSDSEDPRIAAAKASIEELRVVYPISLSDHLASVIKAFDAAKHAIGMTDNPELSEYLDTIVIPEAPKPKEDKSQKKSVGKKQEALAPWELESYELDAMTTLNIVRRGVARKDVTRPDPAINWEKVRELLRYPSARSMIDIKGLDWNW